MPLFQQTVRIGSRAAVLLRVQAGPQVGLGHLRRSLSLAQAMGKYDVEGYFLLHPDPRGLAWLHRAGQSGALLSDCSAFGDEDARKTLRAAQERGAHVVILDCDDIPLGYIEQLRAAGLCLVVRDDLARRPLPVEVVVNGNADAQRLAYDRWNGQRRFLLGPRYAVLSREYAEPFRREVRPEVSRVLVAIGGADLHGGMSALLERLDRLPGGFDFTAVVGPFFEEPIRLEGMRGRLRRPIRFIRCPDTLAPWIAEADVAVSAGGQTLYELACFGCPTVAFQAAGNQGGQLAAMAEAGCVMNAGLWNESDGLDRVEQAMSELIQSSARRERMARAGQALIDGLGADRVAGEIAEAVGLRRQGVFSG